MLRTRRRAALPDPDATEARRADPPGDDVQRGHLRDLDLLRGQPVLLQLLGDQVPVRDLDLLLLGVPWGGGGLVWPCARGLPEPTVFRVSLSTTSTEII